MKHSIMKTSLLAASSLLMAGLVWAEPSSTVAFDKETRALFRAADIAAGQEKANALNCAKCHGDNGISDEDNADTPSLAGQLATYNYKQLKDFAAGNRDGIMPRELKKANKKAALSDQDLVNIVAWYESLEPPVSAEGGGDVAHKLVYKGDPKRMVKPCATCHGRSGQGDKYDAARIAGMPAEAFVTAMEEFAEDDRSNDIYSRMRLIAKALTEEEIKALADFYNAAP